MKKRYLCGYFFLFSYFFFFIVSNASGLCPEKSSGQLVYVPAYSHIYRGNTERPFLLTVTLSIRNIDPKYPLTLVSVDYYKTQGHLLKNYVTKITEIPPLGSIRFIVPESDKTGGSGANFLVKWRSEKRINPPIIETVMIGTQTQQGISFTSRGRVVHTTK